MRALWIGKDGLRPYRREDLSRLFKWALFEHDGTLVLAAMPYDAGWLFHMEAVAQTALQSGWCDAKAAEKFLKRSGNLFHEAGIRVLGGGTRYEDGRIRNYSYRFGAVPEKCLPAVLAALHLA